MLSGTTTRGSEGGRSRMNAETRSSTWRRRAAAVAVGLAGAALWAGVAFGGGAGSAANDRGGAGKAPKAAKAAKRAHVARVQTRAHDGECPFAHDGGASAQL